MQVGGRDLGAEEAFFSDAVREYDGSLSLGSYTPTEVDPEGPIRRLVRVGPDGPPELVARIEGESPQISEGESPFVAAGGNLYFVLQTEASNTLASMPLVGQTPARRRGRRR